MGREQFCIKYSYWIRISTNWGLYVNNVGRKTLNKKLKIIISIIIFFLFIYFSYFAFESHAPHTSEYHKYSRIKIGAIFLCLSVLAFLHRKFWVREMQYVFHLWSAKSEMRLKKQNWWPRILDIYVVAIGSVFLALSIYLILKELFTF